MTLIVSAIFSKTGKVLLCRVFVANLLRSRLEGLLDAFPKLVAVEKGQRQHTYIETESVRYVYQPMDQIYMVLITTRKSNIIEDLETLRLFAKIIPEYCRSNDEAEVFKNSFELLAAFDEVVVMGYRESVNLAQIRTFTEMDSHEERVHNQIQAAQQRQAKNSMAEKIKEMKREAKKKGALGGYQSGFGRNASSAGPTAPAASSFKTPVASVDFLSSASRGITSSDIFKSKPKPGGSGKALKLGAKNPTEDSFLEQLRQEGQSVVDSSSAAAPRSKPEVKGRSAPVSFTVTEKVSAEVTRDGQVKSAEIKGSVSLNISDPLLNTVAVRIANNDTLGAQFQVHPNLDKKMWLEQGVLRLKSIQKPFPPNVDVGILKWRLAPKEEDELPITATLWTDPIRGGGFSVSAGYTLQDIDKPLEDVVITIPLPTGAQPIVSVCEGDYEYRKSRNELIWTIHSVDQSNLTGALEFNVDSGHPESFFPLSLAFHSASPLVDVSVNDVFKFDDSEASVSFDQSTSSVSEDYKIV